MRFLTPATLTMVLLVVVGGLVVGYVAKTMLATEAPVPEERRNYPMAISDLKPGTLITEAHLAQGPWLASQSRPTYARSNTVLLGRVVKNPLKAATPIDTLDLYPPGEGMPLDIAVGRRAYEVSLDESVTLSGLAKPGEYFDVHFTPSATNDRRFRGGFTMTMFKGVKVLAVNRSARNTTSVGRGGSSVTLELTPEQVNIMTLARQHGRIDLVYTPDGPGDGGVAVADKDRAFFEEILGLKPREADKEPKITEIYYGSGRRTEPFNDDGSRYSGAYGRGDGDGDGYDNYAPYVPGARQPPLIYGNGFYRGASDAAGNGPGNPNTPGNAQGNPYSNAPGQGNPYGGRNDAPPGQRMQLIPSPRPVRQPGARGGFMTGF